MANPQMPNDLDPFPAAEALRVAPHGAETLLPSLPWIRPRQVALAYAPHERERPA
jgi:hypothetical protein